MIVGIVKGSLVATRKNEALVGQKLMIVEVLGNTDSAAKKLVATDNVGEGVGDTVLVACGSAARVGCRLENAPVDAAIVGIVDEDQKLDL